MLLDIQNLCVVFRDQSTPTVAVERLDLSLDRGEIVGIVGESGSGKSTAVHALMGLLPGAEVTGKALFEGVDLLHLPDEQRRKYQGNELSIIFQEPMTSLNPTMKIGRQVEEPLRIHTKLPRQARKERALEAMALAELDDPEALYHCYPYELSGGMRQRVMIASALVLRPKLLIADEPTTALDVTIQAEILRTLKEINRREHIAIWFISHDLGVVRRLCSRVVVMQNGFVVEQGPVDEVFYHPQQPYTQRLLASRPTRTKLKGGAERG